jgi:hypothetical protein
MTQPDLVPCNEPGPIKDVNRDLPPPYCSDQELDCSEQLIPESQKEVTGRDFSWLQKVSQQEKTGIGQSALCDPMQTGHISNNQSTPETNATTLYKYAKAIRGCDEAMMDLFRDIIVIDEGNKEHVVPIVPATQEKAVAYILNDNVRKDDSLIVDRIRLPIMAIHSSGINFDQKRYVYHKAVDYLRDLRGQPTFTIKDGGVDRSTIFGVAKGIPVDVQYTLWVWTMHREDMNQIVEQIIPKFSPIAYIRVRGVSWEIGVKLDSIANNIQTDPGDKKYNIFKYQFTMTAQTYIPQPLVRKRAVLKAKTEIVNAIEDADITEVIGRLESALKELQ